MIKKLYVDGFKSLNDFEIEFTPFSVVIGNNASGKSTVLQALDFLACSVQEDFNVIIERRGLTVQNIKSKFKTPSKITFRSVIELEIKGEKRILEWILVVSAYTQKNSMLLDSEMVSDYKSGQPYLDWNTVEPKIYGLEGEEKMFSTIVYKSSVLNLMEEKKMEQNYPELYALKRTLLKTLSFELLSPDKMRLSSRGRTDTMGREGDQLALYIKSMSAQQKKRFEGKLNDLLPGKIQSIEAQTKGRPGWTGLEAVERYKNKNIAISSKDFSDGMLRLLAFLAVTELNAHTMLLDEIENGINVGYAEKLIEIFTEVTKDPEKQLIITTHSTVFLDYVDPEDIIYIYRNSESGYTQAIHLLAIPKMKTQLEGFYPGEIILNLTNEEIIERVLRQGE